ncbi:unnamed protein product [Schistocephalus solidus]|uniref:RING-type domain-containing protein n=1 Tax=Schistocephalus solidus TaxID=70667 RepID=A0A183SPC4_SCHSO|nr:unnamed protein product [Schistocephalus solidus]
MEQSVEDEDVLLSLHQLLVFWSVSMVAAPGALVILTAVLSSLRLNSKRTVIDRAMSMIPIKEPWEFSLFDEDEGANLRTPYFLDKLNGPPPADATALSRLPKRTLTSENIVKSESCPICFDDYAAGEVVITLPCEHFFHENCITRWLKEVFLARTGTTGMIIYGIFAVAIGAEPAFKAATWLVIELHAPPFEPRVHAMLFSIGTPKRLKAPVLGSVYRPPNASEDYDLCLSLAFHAAADLNLK